MLADYPLRALNTLHMAATGSHYIAAGSTPQLLEALSWARARQLPVMPLGGGSNVVMSGRLDYLVVHVCSRGMVLEQEDADSASVCVAAGENWHDFVTWSLANKLYGLENLALIPGSVGAAPIQNIGAYGVELAEFVQRVDAVDRVTGEELSLTREQCRFAYRDSVFKQSLRDKLVITHVVFKLRKAARLNVSYGPLNALFESAEVGARTPRDVYDAVVRLRRERLPDPAVLPNVGSFFKNPVVSQAESDMVRFDAPGIPVYPAAAGRFKLPAAYLIEACGFKGLSREGVGVHKDHALVLVNYGADSAEKLLALAAAIQTAVSRRFGVALEIEPQIFGDAA